MGQECKDRDREEAPGGDLSERFLEGEAEVAAAEALVVLVVLAETSSRAMARREGGHWELAFFGTPKSRREKGSYDPLSGEHHESSIVKILSPLPLT